MLLRTMLLLTRGLPGRFSWVWRSGGSRAWKRLLELPKPRLEFPSLPKLPSWGLPSMTPTIWLGGAVAACLALFAAGVTIKHRAQLEAALATGKAIGTGEASKATLEAATKTAEAERQAAEEVGTVTADRAAILALCRRSASCKERSSLK